MGNDKDKKLEREVRRMGLSLMGDVFNYASHTLCDQQREFEEVRKAQDARIREFDETWKEFDEEWRKWRP